MKNKILAYLFAGIGTVCFLGISYHACLHDDLTQMQMVKQIWWVLLIMCVSLGLGCHHFEQVQQQRKKDGCTDPQDI